MFFKVLYVVTVPDERVFIIYPGEVPEDVMLAADHLNGKEFAFPFANTSGCTITEVVHPNNAHSYTLRVPFDHPVVTKVQALLEVGIF